MKTLQIVVSEGLADLIKQVIAARRCTDPGRDHNWDTYLGPIIAKAVAEDFKALGSDKT